MGHLAFQNAANGKNSLVKRFKFNLIKFSPVKSAGRSPLLICASSGPEPRSCGIQCPCTAKQIPIKSINLIQLKSNFKNFNLNQLNFESNAIKFKNHFIQDHAHSFRAHHAPRDRPPANQDGALPS